jgi:hypothetical protein
MRKYHTDHKRIGKGYLRFHRQLTALKKNDIFMVKKLAAEARSHIAEVSPGTLQMMLVSL